LTIQGALAYYKNEEKLQNNMVFEENLYFGGLQVKTANTSHIGQVIDMFVLPTTEDRPLPKVDQGLSIKKY
jgi:hypothetical protein